MRIARTIPPAAAPLTLQDMTNGLQGLLRRREEILRFERELKAHFQVGHAFLAGSGQAALTLSLKALHSLHPNRKEVLIPAYTCYSVPAAIVRAGLKIRLCDVDPGTLDFDLQQLADILEKHRTDPSGILAVVPAHLYGLPADMVQIRQIAARYSIPVIEDAAQAMEARINGQPCGTLGEIGFFSLGRGKSMTTVSGGIILTRNSQAAKSIESQIGAVNSPGRLQACTLIIQGLALAFLSRPCLFWLPKGLPFLKLGQTVYDPVFSMQTLSSFQAGLSRNWEHKLQTFQSIRTGHAAFYTDILRKTVVASDPLFQKTALWFRHLIRYPARISEPSRRASLLESSEVRGLGLMPGYPASINNIPQIRGMFQGQRFPGAEQTARELITLPVHPYVSATDRENIAECILSSCAS